MTPSSPNVTASTALSLASIVMTMSPSHASATDLAGVAPCSASAATLSCDRLYAVTSWPDFSRFAAMPAPMFPSPMNPIFMPSTMPGICVNRRGVRLSDSIGAGKRRLVPGTCGQLVPAVGVDRQAAEVGGLLDRPLGLFREHVQCVVDLAAVVQHVACRMGQVEGPRVRLDG